MNERGQGNISNRPTPISCARMWENLVFRVPFFTRIARRRCSLALPKWPPTPRSRGAIKSLIQFIASPPPHISEFMIKSGEGGNVWEPKSSKRCFVYLEAIFWWVSGKFEIRSDFAEFGKNPNLIMNHFRVSILNYSHSYRGKGSRRNCRKDTF